MKDCVSVPLRGMAADDLTMHKLAIGHLEDDPDIQAVYAAWDEHGQRLAVTAENQDALRRGLIELANTNDARAQEAPVSPEERRFLRQVRDQLGRLAACVSKAAPALLTEAEAGE